MLVGKSLTTITVLILDSIQTQNNLFKIQVILSNNDSVVNTQIKAEQRAIFCLRRRYLLS